MKTKFKILLFLLFPWPLSAQTPEEVLEIWANPIPLLNNILSQIKAAKTEGLDYERDKKLGEDLQGLAYAINQEIMAAESPGWATPSPERKAVIEKWGEILEPYTADLVKMALEKDTRSTRASRQSRSLLDFAPPTPTFANQVRLYIKQSSLIAFAAADLLYEHRLLSQGDIDILEKNISKAKNEDEKIRLVGFLKSYGVSDYDSFLLEKARSILRSNPKSNTPEDINDHYGVALTIASGLGPDAVSLLPEIETLIANPLIRDLGFLPRLEDVRSYITGKNPRQGRFAKNGSGPLSSWLMDRNTKRSETDSSSSESLTTSKRSIDQKLYLPTLNEEPTSPTPWSMIVVGVVAVLGLLWLLLKKRK
jgi:hypothetical protein